jgi:hypothetical protein
MPVLASMPDGRANCESAGGGRVGARAVRATGGLSWDPTRTSPSARPVQYVLVPQTRPLRVKTGQHPTRAARYFWRTGCIEFISFAPPGCCVVLVVLLGLPEPAQ